MPHAVILERKGLEVYSIYSSFLLQPVRKFLSILPMG